MFKEVLNVDRDFVAALNYANVNFFLNTIKA